MVGRLCEQEALHQRCDLLRTMSPQQNRSAGDMSGDGMLWADARSRATKSAVLQPLCHVLLLQGRVMEAWVKETGRREAYSSRPSRMCLSLRAAPRRRFVLGPLHALAPPLPRTLARRHAAVFAGMLRVDVPASGLTRLDCLSCAGERGREACVCRRRLLYPDTGALPPHIVLPLRGVRARVMDARGQVLETANWWTAREVGMLHRADPCGARLSANTHTQDPRSWRQAFDAIVTPLHDLPSARRAQAWQWLRSGALFPGRFLPCVGSLNDLSAVAYSPSPHRHEPISAESLQSSEGTAPHAVHAADAAWSQAAPATHHSALFQWIRGGSAQEDVKGDAQRTARALEMEHLPQPELVAVLLGAPTRHCRYITPPSPLLS